MLAAVSANSLINHVMKEFENRFGYQPVLARAPGRINLIGEHIDYNQGLVLPGSIENSIFVAIGRSQKDGIRALAYDYSDYQEITIENRPTGGDWSNYVYGVVAEVAVLATEARGVDLVFAGNIPAGAGLSSSAALTCSIGTGLNYLFELGLSAWDIAFMGQKVEHNYVGVQCGIMDQFASVFGQEGKLMRLDCRSHDFQYFDLELGEMALVLCDSGVKHALASSEYNTRRAECEKGVEILSRSSSQVKSLRDVTMVFLASHKGQLPATVYDRCKYVVEENARVEKACDALASSDLIGLGELMFQTHKGLKEDYQVSCPELDLLVHVAAETESVLGARMMGGGFGGCSINIVKADQLEAFARKMSREFLGSFGKELKVNEVRLGSGAEVIR